MENSDKTEKIKSIQNRVKIAQESLKDTSVSEGGELEITMNGNVQITELRWLKPASNETEQTKIFLKTTNQAILNIDLKLKQAIQEITQSMNLPNI